MSNKSFSKASFNKVVSEAFRSLELGLVPQQASTMLFVAASGYILHVLRIRNPSLTFIQDNYFLVSCFMLYITLLLLSFLNYLRL